ncbi:hypothetical protein [Streptococcus pyogenes]|uniref:hypothetical protein n=1 Tax=Streptococcus pyogenes TaxID=1314 RepID=UPI0010D1660B|nr:hypothetical protein [Streptococcus pyogenes]VGV69485.1 Uncharacterised protein [Streptococcus pyogenes]VGV82851.1 Uncharacterised protein [Streptococcus pyogenes]
MKTRSKRFLNLATLCLALLGTALLMAHPVKAEVVLSDPQPVTQDSGQHDSRGSQQEGVGGSYSDNGEERRKQAYQAGWDAGLLAGKGAEQPNVERENIPPSAYDNTYFDVEYKDGYQGGHRKGWDEGHPVQATLNWLWNIVSEWFTWFE